MKEQYKPLPIVFKNQWPIVFRPLLNIFPAEIQD